LGNFFVNETRNNWNQFPNETYASTFVIENFNTTIIAEADFQQVYVFQNVNFTSVENEKANVNPSVMAFVAANPSWVSEDSEESSDSEEL